MESAPEEEGAEEPAAAVMPKPCKCGKPAREGQRTCRECHAAYMRRWRSAHVYVKRELLHVEQSK